VYLPQCSITDWPDLHLRHIYWDDAHHLERLPELKRAVRQAAFFKINGFALKLEGHFQFRSAPALVEPYALSPVEYQELTDYALRYHVQLIPFLDGPGHIAFILKHPEYAKYRSFTDSNYELCATNPEAVKFLSGMFQDLADANRGGKFIYLSTDEPYYVGMADNPNCREKGAAAKLGSVGKLLAQFIGQVAEPLHNQGRTVMFWGEYPLVVSDIASLPPYLVNGEVYGPEFDPVFRKHGIKQMIYTSTQGEERLFPSYFGLPNSRRLHAGRQHGGAPVALDRRAGKPT
jgi:N-acetyl-beta-hexosaminidase